MTNLVEIVKDKEQATVVKRYIRDNLTLAEADKVRAEWYEGLDVFNKTMMDILIEDGGEADVADILEEYFDLPHFDPFEFGEAHNIDWRGLEESYGIEGGRL